MVADLVLAIGDQKILRRWTLVSGIAIVNPKQFVQSPTRKKPCLFRTGFAANFPASSLDHALQALAQCELRFFSLASKRSTHSHLLDAECA